MFRFSAVFVSLLALAAATPSASAASFSCYGNVTDTEQAICDNPQLSRLDSQMAAAYFRQLRVIPVMWRPSYRASQIQWLDYRNSCGANVGCLANAYTTQIDDLRHFIP